MLRMRLPPLILLSSLRMRLLLLPRYKQTKLLPPLLLLSSMSMKLLLLPRKRLRKRPPSKLMPKS